MSTKAVILVETTIGTVKEVAAALRQLDGVKSADVVTGPYDVIAILEAEDFTDVGHIVTGKINAISGVCRTIVCATQNGP